MTASSAVRRNRQSRRRIPALLAVLVALGAVLSPLPAAAQLLDFLFRPRGQVYELPQYYRDGRPVSPRQTAPSAAPAPSQDFSRAPPPRRTDAEPSLKVVVMGDSLADWLAYGLEDAWSEKPDQAVIRRHRAFSGLIRYDARSDGTWADAARDILKTEKADFVVMLVGIADRQPIRERAAGRRAAEAKLAQPQESDQPAADDDEEAPSIAAPEPQAGGATALAYRTEEWAQAYSRRIDETMTALKSAGVPVLWVSIPSIRGTRSTSDAAYLNGLYRAAAEKNGVVYVDLWDGFVDENGRFMLQGPDVDGQIRRLRTSDGVHFTRAGARKLAFYVDREILRLRSDPRPVALPVPEAAPGAAPDPASEPEKAEAPGARPRPLAGPVLPLTAVAEEGDELLGARAPAGQGAGRPLVGDARPPAARADDSTWPRSAIVYVEAAPGPTPVSIAAAPAATDEAKGARRPDPGAQAKARIARPRPPVAVSGPPRPPAEVGRSAFGSFFGLFR